MITMLVFVRDKVRSPLRRLKGPVGLGFAWRLSLVGAKNPSIGPRLPRLSFMFAHASASTVETTGSERAADASGRPPCDWPAVARAASSAELAEFTAATGRTAMAAELERLARERTRGADPHEAADTLAAWVHESVAYVPGATGVHTNAQESWDQGEGVCQDFSHMTVALMRAVGLPARYVSGYLFPDPQAQPGTSADGQSHAWVEYWAGGWHGLDATNRTVPGLQHVVVGHGRDYADVLPHKGIYHGAPGSSLKVSVRFTRLI